MSHPIIDTRFFRAGVGTVIYNQAGEVTIFERSQYPVGVWQFQQGGIDLGEAVETTLWRELQEEVGLTAEDFLNVSPLPRWTVYQDHNSVDDKNKSRLGQAHRWFFLELKPDRSIDLTTATMKEFSAHRWCTFAEAIDITDDLKKHVYQTLETHFFEHIRPDLAV